MRVRAVSVAAATLITLSCAPLQAIAQSEPAPTPAPSAASALAGAATTGAPHVAAGTPIDLELAEALDSKILKRGDKFALKLALPIMLDGKVIVPAGTTGVGQVVDAAASGPLGRPAKLLLAARYLEFNGRQIPLRTLQLGRAGKDNSDTVMAVSFVPYVGMLGMFMHGGEIEIPAGQRAQAKLAADVEAPTPTTEVAATPATPSTEGPQKP